MRHGAKINHLGRKTSHRKALLRNLACQLIQHKRIVTTLAKAKSLRVFVEPLLTKSKKDDTHNRRVVFSYLHDKDTIKELFSTVSSKIADRPGGYCRIIKLERRIGDAADMAMIELVDFNEVYNPSVSLGTERKKTRRGRSKKTSQAKTESSVAAVETESKELVDEVKVDNTTETVADTHTESESTENTSESNTTEDNQKES